MTATVAAPTIDSVLKRTDAQWARRFGDDPAPPEYLAAHAAALRPLLEQNGGPGVDAEEVARLRSESDARGRIIAQRDATIEGLKERLAKARQAGTAGVERVTRERDEARRQLADARAQGTGGAAAAEVESLTREVAELKEKLAAADEDARRRIDAAVGAVTAATDGMAGKVDELRRALAAKDREINEARAERDTARGQLRDAAPAADTSRLTAEIAELKQQLATQGQQLAAATRDLALANRTLDEIADEEADRQAAVPHRHQFEVDLKTGKHANCECGQPWIRDLAEDGDPVVPDVEPLAVMFDRIRAEVAEAGWAS
ncbi:hypothetical protein [Amycolatopsis sp. NPDC004378]